ncbi:MAG: response regulator [Desulfobacterales bacterium]|nr:MAG: response regulator [Desulfobacterales bacterium]
MDPKKIIRGKRVLVVDDEQDVLDALIEHLDICKIDTASSFEEAKQLLEENLYDIAILDIMGVDGFSLLEIAIARGIPALMLTAHALSEDTLKKSADMCASYYVPKEEIHKIEIFVADVIEAVEKKKSPWIKCFERLGSFYDERFGGTNWREKEKEFWERRIKPLK